MSPADFDVRGLDRFREHLSVYEAKGYGPTAAVGCALMALAFQRAAAHGGMDIGKNPKAFEVELRGALALIWQENPDALEAAGFLCRTSWGTERLFWGWLVTTDGMNAWSRVSDDLYGAQLQRDLKREVASLNYQRRRRHGDGWTRKNLPTPEEVIGLLADERGIGLFRVTPGGLRLKRHAVRDVLARRENVDQLLPMPTPAPGESVKVQREDQEGARPSKAKLQAALRDVIKRYGPGIIPALVALNAGVSPERIEAQHGVKARSLRSALRFLKNRAV